MNGVREARALRSCRLGIPVFAAILLAAWTGCNKPAVKETAPEPSVQTAPQPQPEPEKTTGPAAASKPEVTLVTDDAIVQALADAKGKVLVVNVWATFCIPCMEEMPELATFYRERDAEHVAFLSIDTDPVFTLDDVVKPFVQEKAIPFPVHVWNDLPPDQLIAALGVKDTGWDGELPATFVFGPDGSLKKHWLERVHLHDLSAAVAEISQS